MLKTNFTPSSCLHYRNRRSMKRAGKKRNAKAFSFRSILKGSAALCLAVALQYSAGAQCNTFFNADAANPILSVLPAGKFVYAVNFVDIDADGDLDCYVSTSDYFTPGLYLNKGNAHHPVYEKSAQSGFHKKDNIYSQNFIQFVDIDGDGDLDCFASDVETGGYYYVHIRFFQNTGTPQSPNFIENQAANPVGSIKSGNYVAFQFADMDGDGDFDLYYYDHSPYFSQPSYDAIIMNTGTKTSPVLTKYVSYEKDLNYHKDRVYYDWNKDGLLDYFSSAEDYSIFRDVDTRYYRNTGPKNHPNYIKDTVNVPRFKNGGPYQIVDLNGDGAPEVFTFNGHYSTLAPVAIIRDTTKMQNGMAAHLLYSVHRSTDYQYQWELNGKKIQGANDYFIKVTKAGSYSLSITNGCGTGISLYYPVTDSTFTAQDKTAVVAASSLIAIQAYPNPFTQSFTVQLPSSIDKATLRITDLAGRILQSQTTTSGSLTLGSTLQKGTYLLQVLQNGNVVYTTKLMKQ